MATFKVGINRERINFYRAQGEKKGKDWEGSQKRHVECCLGNGPSEAAAMLLLCSLSTLAALGALLVVAVIAVLVVVLVPLALVLVVLLPLLSVLREVMQCIKMHASTTQY